jgi:hypothetical protein
MGTEGLHVPIFEPIVNEKGIATPYLIKAWQLLQGTAGIDLLTEIAARTAADAGLTTRIDALEGAIIESRFFGNGVVIPAGLTAYTPIPSDCTLTGWLVFSDDSAVTAGSIVVDVWHSTDAGFPPTIADTITDGTPPTMTAATKASSNDLSAWSTTALAAGDWIATSVISATTVTAVGVQLFVTRT